MANCTQDWGPMEDWECLSTAQRAADIFCVALGLLAFFVVLLYLSSRAVVWWERRRRNEGSYDAASTHVADVTHPIHRVSESRPRSPQTQTSKATAGESRVQLVEFDGSVVASEP